jgi:peptidoglycan/LPS O-acetylase OafA/YrhL
LRQRADLTFGIYCLHWPILMLCLRRARARGLAESDVAAFLTIFAPTILGALACATMYDAVLGKVAPSSPASKRFPAVRRSSSVLSGWESE